MDNSHASPPRWSEHNRHRFFRSLHKQNQEDGQDFIKKQIQNTGVAGKNDTAERSETFPSVHEITRYKIAPPSNKVSTPATGPYSFERIEKLEKGFLDQMKFVDELRRKDAESLDKLNQRISTCETEILKSKMERCSDKRKDAADGFQLSSISNVGVKSDTRNDTISIPEVLQLLHRRETEEKQRAIAQSSEIQLLKQQLYDMQREIKFSLKAAEKHISALTEDVKAARSRTSQPLSHDLSIIRTKESLNSENQTSQLRIMMQALASEVVRLKQQNMEQELRIQQGQKDAQNSSERLQNLIFAKETQLDDRILQVKQTLISKSQHEKSIDQRRLQLFEEGAEQLRDSAGERNDVIGKALKLERERRLEADTNIKQIIDLKFETIESLIREQEQRFLKSEQEIFEFSKSLKSKTQSIADQLEKKHNLSSHKIVQSIQTQMRQLSNTVHEQIAGAAKQSQELEKIIRAEVKVRKSITEKLDNGITSQNDQLARQIAIIKSNIGSKIELIQAKQEKYENWTKQINNELEAKLRRNELNAELQRKENASARAEILSQLLKRSEDIEKVVEEKAKTLSASQKSFENSFEDKIRSLQESTRLERGRLENKLQMNITLADKNLRELLVQESNSRINEITQSEIKVLAKLNTVLSESETILKSRIDILENDICLEKAERNKLSIETNSNMLKIEVKALSEIKKIKENYTETLNHLEEAQAVKYLLIENLQKENRESINKLSVEVNKKSKQWEENLHAHTSRLEERIGRGEEGLEMFKARTGNFNTCTNKKLDLIEKQNEHNTETLMTEVQRTSAEIKDDCKRIVESTEKGLKALLENNATALRLRLKTSVQAESASRLQSLDELCEDFNRRTRNQERLYKQYVSERIAALRDALESSIETEKLDREENINRAQSSLSAFVVKTADDIAHKEEVTQALESIVSQVQALHVLERFSEVTEDIECLASETSNEFKNIKIQQEQGISDLQNFQAVTDTVNSICIRIIEEDTINRNKKLENDINSRISEDVNTLQRSSIKAEQNSVNRDKNLSEQLNQSYETLRDNLSRLKTQQNAMKTEAIERDNDRLIKSETANLLEYMCSQIVEEGVTREIRYVNKELTNMFTQKHLNLSNEIQDIAKENQHNIWKLQETHQQKMEKIASVQEQQASQLESKIHELGVQEANDYISNQTALCMEVCLQKISEEYLLETIENNQQVTENNIINLENRQEIMGEKIDSLGTATKNNTTFVNDVIAQLQDTKKEIQDLDMSRQKEIENLKSKTDEMDARFETQKHIDDANTDEIKRIKANIEKFSVDVNKFSANIVTDANDKFERMKQKTAELENESTLANKTKISENMDIPEPEKEDVEPDATSIEEKELLTSDENKEDVYNSNSSTVEPGTSSYET